MSPSEPDQPVGKFSVTVTAVRGPDGRHWVHIQVVNPPLTLGFAVGHDVIGQLVTNLEQAADQARRADLGILVPATHPDGLLR